MAFYNVAVDDCGVAGREFFGDAVGLANGLHLRGYVVVNLEACGFHVGYPFFAAAAGRATVDGELRYATSS